MVANMTELEARVSSMRLKLMDKRKELRETVHEHYTDLIGVADHAVSVSGKTEIILNGSARMNSLGRALRVRAATAQLSQHTATPPEQIPPENANVEGMLAVEAILSLNGRLLNGVNVMNFTKAQEMLEFEIPGLIKKFEEGIVLEEYRLLCLHEIESFSNASDRVKTYCWRSLSSASLDDAERMCQCVALLKKCAGNNVNEFWSRRSMVLASFDSSWALMHHFHLSVLCATKSEIPLDAEFISHYGTNEGVISSVINKEFSSLESQAVRERYFELKKNIADLRLGGRNCVPEIDVLTILEFQAKRFIKESIGLEISKLEFNFDNFDVQKVEESVTNLFIGMFSFDLIPSSEILSEISREMIVRINTGCQESDRSKRSGVNTSVLINRIEDASSTSTLNELFPYLSDSIQRLRDHQKDCFEMHFDEIVNEAANSNTAKKSFPSFSSFGGNFHVPTHLSAFLLSVILQTEKEITNLPSHCHSMASISAKSALSRFFCAHFTSSLLTNLLNLQSLFDLHSVIILTSSPSSSADDYEYLSTQILRDVEESVLSEHVDSLLYKDSIKISAYLSIARNKALFQPLILANPMFSHHSAIHESETTNHTSLMDAVAPLPTGDKFPTLPVSRSMISSGPAQIQAPKKQQSNNMFSASSVSSFLNQVGKITLGSSQ